MKIPKVLLKVLLHDYFLANHATNIHMFTVSLHGIQAGMLKNRQQAVRARRVFGYEVIATEAAIYSQVCWLASHEVALMRKDAVTHYLDGSFGRAV